jgi:hypothetical protein
MKAFSTALEERLKKHHENTFRFLKKTGEKNVRCG